MSAPPLTHWILPFASSLSEPCQHALPRLGQDPALPHLKQLLQRLQRERGLSYLLITHDIDVIRAMAHQVLVMRNGEIVESGSLNQITQQPKNDYTALLVQ